MGAAHPHPQRKLARHALQVGATRSSSWRDTLLKLARHALLKWARRAPQVGATRSSSWRDALLKLARRAPQVGATRSHHAPIKLARHTLRPRALILLVRVSTFIITSVCPQLSPIRHPTSSLFWYCIAAGNVSAEPRNLNSTPHKLPTVDCRLTAVDASMTAMLHTL